MRSRTTHSGESERRRQRVGLQAYVGVEEHGTRSDTACLATAC
jgi:hypothetical protein